MAGAPVGNQNAAKGTLWNDAIRRAVSRKAEGNLNHGLDTLADKLVSAAEKGDQWALIEIGNRFDGRPAQAVIVAGDDENPLKHKHTVEFIGASAATQEA